MNSPWSAPILGTPVLVEGDVIPLATADAGTLLQAGVLVDVTNTWRTLYPDAELFDGGAVIGGDNGPVLAINENPELIPDIPQSPDIARELGELNDYLRQQTAEYWRKAAIAEQETSRKIDQLQADTQRQSDERLRRTQQIVDDLERERDRQQAEIDLWQLNEHNRQQAEYFAQEDQKLLQGFKDAVKAAKVGVLSKTAGELRAAGVGSTSAGSGGSAPATGGGGAGSGNGKPKPETEADHAAHRAAGRRIQEEAARRARTQGPEKAREWAQQEAARYKAANPEGQPEQPDFWRSYLSGNGAGSGILGGTQTLTGDDKHANWFWLALAAALVLNGKDK